MARVGFAFDKKGFDKLVENLSPESRKPVVREAIQTGAIIVRDKIRDKYRGIKPDSKLDKAIVAHIYPSGEGAVVRRFYVKGGTSRNYSSDSPMLRAYILNFIEQGATDRQLKGRGKYPRGTNRGSIPAYKFFRKGMNAGKRRAIKEIERILLDKLSKQANK